MRPMTRLFLGLVFLVGILGAVALGLPAHVTVTRSVVINAPEPAVYPYLNNLHNFADWSPWAVRDPQLAVSYSGPQEGKGAKIQWTSKVPSIGTGTMEITGGEPNRHIDLAVNFNGLDGTSAYDIAPSGSGSKVTWNFGYDSGTSPLKRWKALMLDGFVGADYRTGLDRLKEKIESERRPTEPTIGVMPEGGVSTQPEQPAAALPPGAAPQGAVTPGQAVPQADGAAPAAGAQPDAAAPAAEATPAPAPAPAPPPKKKKRRP
jgi:polyketide cyclase/dehydrase/lipid transport protein